MDKITIDRINKAHPIIRESLMKEYIEINNRLPKDVRLRFAYVLRTPEEQDALFKKRPKVTNAKAWQSIHNYGLAFDIVILYDKDNNGTFETAVWDHKDKYWIRVTEYFKSKGWSWGGDWKKFKDYPHFEKNFGLTWKQMKSMIDGGKFTIQDGVKYINLAELN
jgi:peptidoglycan L-alanyl-D-glutamate endopeptidase CwlK